MADVDSAQHEVVFRVAVIGGVGNRLLQLLKVRDGELSLGSVAGYKPRFLFEQFADDPWGGDGNDGARFEALVPSLDAIVFTDDFADGFHYSSSAVERISKILSPLKLRIPSAIFGGPALAEDWSSLSGAPVLAQVDPKSEDATSILKALVKALLRSNIRSTPPPPVV
jgi:hypothetical protein